ncbi:hypothetical protein BHM03_00046139 [Ensete ventricosum]|uniref:Uncharacterized protein n=1 Tax=Ensete ventricosum TaxID=4639 RepID=A0A445ML32_ENSVE|nr:hypothetical protein BHM03_00046139 [Ensete ventricosum]
MATTSGYSRGRQQHGEEDGVIGATVKDEARMGDNSYRRGLQHRREGGQWLWPARAAARDNECYGRERRGLRQGAAMRLRGSSDGKEVEC